MRAWVLWRKKIVIFVFNSQEESKSIKLLIKHSNHIEIILGYLIL